MFIWIAKSGERIKSRADNMWTKSGEKLFLERTGNLPNGMRIGHYSIHWSGDFVLACRIYADAPLYKDADRLAQCIKARRLLVGHPMRAEIIKDIAREEKFLASHGIVPNKQIRAWAR